MFGPNFCFLGAQEKGVITGKLGRHENFQEQFILLFSKKNIQVFIEQLRKRGAFPHRCFCYALDYRSQGNATEASF